MLSIRNRTPYILKIYAIYLYYSARSLRLASKCLEPLINKEITCSYMEMVTIHDGYK
jgi:hypothetical protein